VAACDGGAGTRKQIAKRYFVRIAWAYKLLAHRRHTGPIAPKPHGRGQPRRSMGTPHSGSAKPSRTAPMPRWGVT
jgi:hypothetical protein